MSSGEERTATRRTVGRGERRDRRDRSVPRPPSHHPRCRQSARHTPDAVSHDAHIWPPGSAWCLATVLHAMRSTTSSSSARSHSPVLVSQLTSSYRRAEYSHRHLPRTTKSREKSRCRHPQSRPSHRPIRALSTGPDRRPVQSHPDPRPFGGPITHCGRYVSMLTRY